MYIVLFEVRANTTGQEKCRSLSEHVRTFLKDQEGFISIERFQSLSDEGKELSLSRWKDEASIQKWRNDLAHRQGQLGGRESFFHSYSIQVAKVVREYSNTDRAQAPADSNEALL